MNIWGKNERSWRRKNRRAVSPIIATILLVAITVVLAAVLYILISQYTKSGGSVTIGSALAIGSSNDGTGTVNYYNMTVESAGSTLTMSSFIFEIRSPTGAITTVGSTVAGVAITKLYIQLVSPTLSYAATYCVAAGEAAPPAGPACPTTGGGVGWSYGSGCTSPAFTTACSSTSTMTTQYTFSVQVGPTTVSLSGYSLVALGQGSFSGTTSGTIT